MLTSAGKTSEAFSLDHSGRALVFAAIAFVCKLRKAGTLCGREQGQDGYCGLRCAYVFVASGSACHAFLLLISLC